MEIWKPVLGWEGLYEASNIGRIRSLPRQGKYRMYGGKVLKPVIRNGYHSVCLNKNRKGFIRYIHRLVLKAFVGKPFSAQYCTNHKNGIRTDNRTENLEWVTYAENNRHSYEVLGNPYPTSPYQNHPGSQAGSKNNGAKLTEDDVLYIRKQYEYSYHWGLLTKLAEQFNVSVSAISEIVHRKRWTHI